MEKKSAEPTDLSACSGCGNDVEQQGLCPWCAQELIEVQPAWGA